MPDTLNTVLICRSPSGTTGGEYPIENIRNPHWSRVSGGYNRVYGWYALYGYIPYEDAEQIVDCSGRHSYYGNNVKICIIEKDNRSENHSMAYRELLKVAGEKPMSVIARNRPGNAPPCTKRILQIMTERKRMLRRTLRKMIINEGYREVTFRRALNDLLWTKLSCEGEPQSPKQIIFVREEDKKYAN